MVNAEPDYQSSVAYVNGEFVPASEASISVFDRGFLYGDGIYETLLAVDGHPFRLDDHLARLFLSATAIRLKMPVERERLRDIVTETLDRNDIPDAYIRILVSRGVSYPVIDPRAATNQPTLIVLVHSRQLPPGVSMSDRKNGIRLQVVSVRKTPSVCIDARIKSLNYLNQILARMEAVDAGADEAVMLDMQGFISEGAGDNLFVIQDHTLMTPTLDNALAGITRKTVFEITKADGYTVVEKNLAPYDLYTADEAFLCSTYGGLLPVAEVNGRPIGTEVPGPVTEAIRGRYEDLERGGR